MTSLVQGHIILIASIAATKTTDTLDVLINEAYDENCALKDNTNPTYKQWLAVIASNAFH